MCWGQWCSGSGSPGLLETAAGVRLSGEQLDVWLFDQGSPKRRSEPREGGGEEAFISGKANSPIVSFASVMIIIVPLGPTLYSLQSAFTFMISFGPRNTKIAGFIIIAVISKSVTEQTSPSPHEQSTSPILCLTFITAKNNK